MRFYQYFAQQKNDKIINTAKWLSDKLKTADDEDEKDKIIAALAILSIENSNVTDKYIQNIINLAKRIN